MIKIGVTGGIGSGKTIVCRLFSTLGVPVFHADDEAKRLMNVDYNIQKKITHLFGNDIYLPDRSLDRSKVASIVFKAPSLLQELNQIIHPAVKASFLRWCNCFDKPYVIHEAAILFESGFYRSMDKNMVVVADEQIRIQRVMNRDGATEAEVKDRIRNQWSDSEKIKQADWVITNNDRELLVPQVLEIDKKIRAYGEI